MTELLKLSAQLLVVVDLAVEDDGVLVFGIAHRLNAVVGQIDDRKTRVGQRDRRNTFILPIESKSAARRGRDVPKRVEHALDGGLGDRLLETDDSGDAAHLTARSERLASDMRSK